MVESVTFRAVRMTGISTPEPRPVMLKGGQPSIQTITYHWCRCDVCHVFQLIDQDDLKATWSCSECQRASVRKGSDKIPECKGRTVKGDKVTHEPIAMTTEDPEPGRSCRMTPRCRGTARRIS